MESTLQDDTSCRYRICNSVWFLSWSPSKEESVKVRTSRGEQKLKGPQYYAHLFARGRSEFFACCQLPWFGGARGFGSYLNFEAFSSLKKCVLGPQHFYEQFLDGELAHMDNKNMRTENIWMIEP